MSREDWVFSIENNIVLVLCAIVSTSDQIFVWNFLICANWIIKDLIVDKYIISSWLWLTIVLGIWNLKEVYSLHILLLGRQIKSFHVEIYYQWVEVFKWTTQNVVCCQRCIHSFKLGACWISYVSL